MLDVNVIKDMFEMSYLISNYKNSVKVILTWWPFCRSRQEADLKKVFESLDPGIPMLCVCGNHDIGNSPTHQTIERYTQNFGDDYFYFAFKVSSHS